MNDIRHALRLIAKKPGFAAAVIVTLAIGIGATSAVFNAINTLLIADLPFGGAERVYWVEPAPHTSFSKSFLVDFRRGVRAFEGVAGYSGWGLTVTGLGEPRNVDGARVTTDFFDVLGVSPFLGRTFAPGDDAVAVVSYDFWRSNFAGADSLAGKTITVGGTRRDIIGVLRPGVRFPERRTDIWLPLTISPADADYKAGYLTLIGRAKNGVSQKQALDDVRAASAATVKLRPKLPKDFGHDAVVTPLRVALSHNLRPTLLLLMGAVVLVLIVACVNVANLTLSRYAARSGEMAVRAAIGAGRATLIRQVLVESLVLALMGGAASLAVAFWCGRLLDLGLAGRVPFDLSSTSPAMLLFALAVSIVAGFLSGAVPALRLARVRFAALRDIGRGATQSRARRRARVAMIAAQIALSLVLLAGAGLLLRSFWNVVNINPGFESSGLLTAELNPPDQPYSDDAQARILIRRILERIDALPEVTASGAVQILPFSGNNWNPSLVVDGRDANEDTEVDWRVITPRYFAAMRVPILAGRAFTNADDEHAPRVTIVNETLAKKLFGTASPIGRRIRTSFEGKEWATIVGVSGDTKDQTIVDSFRPQMYRPHAQNPQSSMVLMIRTTNSSALRRAIAPAVWSIDRRIPVKVTPMREVVGDSLSGARLFLTMLLAFAAIAVFLCGVGIYGVTFDAVAQRTREFGVRLALGSSQRDIVRLVLRDVAIVAAAGAIIGLAGARAATRLLAARLYDVSPTDATTFAAVTALLAAAALFAAWLPARRAGKLNPIEALRHE